MSGVTIIAQTAGQLRANYDNNAVMLGDNKYSKGTYKNTTGASVTLLAGTLMGKITRLANGSTNTVGYLWPHAAANTEGAEKPVGVLKDSVTVANGDTVTLSYAYSGEVDSNSIKFNASETLDTIVTKSITVTGTPNQTFTIETTAIRELIIACTNLILVGMDQLTAYDNS